MADAAVEFLLENLKQLLLDKADLIHGAKAQVARLQDDLCFFNAFLKDSTKKRRKDLCHKELVRRIRNVAYDAEDVIDAYVTQAKDSRSKNYFLRSIKPFQLTNIAVEVEDVRAKVKEIYDNWHLMDFSRLEIGDEKPDDVEAPIVRQENVVGFEDEAAKIIGYLKEETEQLDVISIIGMPGLGKTTLAGKIFRDPTIQYEFPTRIWVYISQEFRKKDIFLNILKQLTSITEDMINHKSDMELAQLVASHLEEGKFLIIMDDMWAADDWEKLQIALPKGNKMGKVLITSRSDQVARKANRNRPDHKLRFLTQEESWKLLNLEVFGKPDCPSEFEVFGKQIVDQCCGLPLAIVIIGGVLVTKVSLFDDINVKRHHWKKNEARSENFLEEIKKLREGGFNILVTNVDQYRRLCIHSNVMDFVNSEKLYGSRIRSFTCFSKEEITLTGMSLTNIPSAFKLLRVLEAKPIKFPKIPSEICKLFHLRYIKLSCYSASLPISFSKFSNLQTLVIDTTASMLDIKVDIWKMIHLRHIKTNASASLPEPEPKTAGNKNEKLQTLGFISPHSCTEKILNQARNLKRLGIRGPLAPLLEGKVGSFDNLATIEGIEKLKLVNDVCLSPASEGQPRFLPQHYRFPLNLRSLTLSRTFLEWSQMSTLGLLGSLEVLKLKDQAFKGKTWETVDGGFRCLEVLFIRQTDLVEWKASGHHFPRLRRLELKNCEELGEIPMGLADVPSLQLLDVYRCKSAAGSAKRICEAIQKKKQEDQTQVGGVGKFKLIIFPLDDLLA
ncbi:Putative disease resistance protein [Striga hermonthica]|uniref:Disease resistance protein n=1 Tax=Striga hermonthica TaxID=68872 RepID=A0A9N7RDB9_STRHE|nr:Putative disease resistance protein [Striga hermonthica]